MEDWIRIAVLDDEAVEIRETERMLSAYGKMHPEHKFTIASHMQVKTFMEKMCFGGVDTAWAYDILLMDVYLEDGNGIQCGRILREKGFAGVIIYKSSTVDNFPEALRLNAMQYLIKPVSEEKLFEAMDQAVEKVMAAPKLKAVDSGASSVPIQATQEKEVTIDTEPLQKRRKSFKELLSGWFHDRPSRNKKGGRT